MRQAVFPDTVLISAPQKAVFISSDLRSGVQPTRLSLGFRPFAIHGERLACLQLLQATRKSWIEPDRMPFSFIENTEISDVSPSRVRKKITLTLEDEEPAVPKQPNG